MRIVKESRSFLSTSDIERILSIYFGVQNCDHELKLNSPHHEFIVCTEHEIELNERPEYTS